MFRQNNLGFHLQRKQTVDTLFSDLPNSFIAGHGTTIDPHDYTFTDSTASVGNLHYRLKQIDLDGTQHFTQSVSVTVVSSVTENPSHEFRLYQNHPNPFNPTTTIAYVLGQELAPISSGSSVTLRVFDLLGGEVATLVNEAQQPGKHTVTFDAKALSSGVYFYRLTAGGLTETKRLVLLK